MRPSDDIHFESGIAALVQQIKKSVPTEDLADDESDDGGQVRALASTAGVMRLDWLRLDWLLTPTPSPRVSGATP